MKLAVLITHPIQYFAPVFRQLASCPGIDLQVFFGTDHGVKASLDSNFNTTFSWDSNPAEGFPHTFVSKGPISRLKGLFGIFLGLKAALGIRKFNPDAVLVFSYSPAFISSSTVLLKSIGNRLLLRAETTDAALVRTGLKDFFRTLVLKSYYKQFSFVFPIGANSVAHYNRMGVPTVRQYPALYSVDVEYFRHQVDKWLPERQKLREAAGIPSDAHVLLYCGKMFPPKDPLIIPAALTAIAPEKISKLWFLAVGDGELRQKFEKQVTEIIKERALFVGFKNQSELGRYYAMADTLILPSKSGETWGLVVNEALQFGLRVVVSDNVGCGRDLVSSKEIGRIFSAGSTQGLASAIADGMLCEKSIPFTKADLPHPALFVNAITTALKSFEKGENGE